MLYDIGLRVISVLSKLAFLLDEVTNLGGLGGGKPCPSLVIGTFDQSYKYLTIVIYNSRGVF